MNLTKDFVAQLDSGDMYRNLVTFSEMFQEGLRLAALMDFPYRASDIDNVVVSGMGGSAIGGELLRALVEPEGAIPVAVKRTYDLPGYVGSRSLFVASSYSGNTEETLAAFDQALARGARIFCITSGGGLLDLARKHGLPHIVIPGGMPPRAALPYSLAPLLEVFRRLQLTPVSVEDQSEAVSILDTGAQKYSALTGNAALNVAQTIQGFITLMYSGTGFMQAVNLRWRGQFQENAKTLAFGNVFPELNHNEIVGWSHSKAFLSSVGVILLRDRDDHPLVQHRIDVTHGLLASKAAFWEEVWTIGESRLARMLSLVQLGDWVSFYLALLNGVDPTPIELIDTLKRELAARSAR